MPARSWLFPSPFYRRSTLIITLLSSCICISNLIFPRQFVNVLIPHSSLPDNQFPLTNRTISITTNRTARFAVVSAIYNDDYLPGVEVLSYSLRRVNTQADLILLYIVNRLNQTTLDRCRKAGWYLWPVERIDPPRFAIVYPHFRDQFTKLRIWSLVGYDRVLYLDADTVVVRDINELFAGTIFEDQHGGLLAAVEDVWSGQIGPNFNAGVLLIRPNQTIFEDMLVKIQNVAAYGSYWAEQAFLNWYLKGSTGRLPLVYSFNMALSIYHRDVYSQLRDRVKIIHYTIDKPFRITKPSQLSYPAFFHLWNVWQQISNEMLNQSLISQI